MHNSQTPAKEPDSANVTPTPASNLQTTDMPQTANAINAPESAENQSGSGTAANKPNAPASLGKPGASAPAAKPAAARAAHSFFDGGVLARALCIVFAIAFVLAGWQLTAVALNTPALPTPAKTLSIFATFAPAIAPSAGVSFYRLAISLAIGTALGLPLGLLLGRSPRLDALFAPVLYILYPLPKIVLLPILLVLLGLADAPKIALISLTVFFQVAMVMRDAAKAVPEQTVLSVRSLGASRLDVWRHVILPATLPDLFTTLRVSSSVGIAVLFFAEAIAGSTGLGYFIMESWAMVNYPRMFAGIVALALLGVVVYEAFDIAERRLTRWRKAR